MDLVGLDVGFSKTRLSSGAARLNSQGLRLGRVGSTWESRSKVLGPVDLADMAAIDAPLLPKEHFEPRACERVFTLGRFQRRCKPGLSHIPGTGQSFREAGFEAAEQLAPHVSDADTATQFPRVRTGKNIVEAFPNAFLGVMIPEPRYEAMPALRRGREKFDWLYDQWCENSGSGDLMAGLGFDNAFQRRCRDCRDREERAALVCLITAGAAFHGTYTAVGDPQGGYFFLPSLHFWADWAQDEIHKQRKRLDGLEIWWNGQRYGQ